MSSATIFEAKTNLSALLRLVQKGETVVITSGRKKTPVAKLTPIEPVAKKRLGAMEIPGYEIPESFWDPLPEGELRLWEGEGE